MKEEEEEKNSLRKEKTTTTTKKPNRVRYLLSKLQTNTVSESTRRSV